MRLVRPSYKILMIMASSFEEETGEILADNSLRLIELAGRTCYKSEGARDKDSHHKLVQKIYELGHDSVIEHSAMTVKFICDRGVSHELVRHRLASFSQESTRYCNYKGGVTFVIPPWVSISEGKYHHQRDINESLNEAEIRWFNVMLYAEATYDEIVSKYNWSPQQARSVLPNSLKTEIVVTANFREWNHIFNLRCDPNAHPQMHELMIPLRDECRKLIPIIFDERKVK